MYYRIFKFQDAVEITTHFFMEDLIVVSIFFGSLHGTKRVWEIIYCTRNLDDFKFSLIYEFVQKEKITRGPRRPCATYDVMILTTERCSL